MKKLFSAVAAAAVLTACASTGGVLLDNQRLVITELNGTEIDSMSEEPANIVFQDGVCSAYVGGNRIRADYQEGKDGRLSFKYGAATKMMVPPEIREDEFLEAFNSVAAYKMDGDTFVFVDSEGGVLFKAAK